MSTTDPGYRQCSISVMDNIADPDISFDKKGICNYYYEYLVAEKANTLRGDAAEQHLKEIVAMLKQKGKNKKYDCIIGVSGGVDSTFLSYMAREYGLRSLCVHFDNGWNSELAVKNIENIITACGFDLYTYVINWEEFRDIQLAYFKAGVIDIEAITDIGIGAALNKICTDFNIGYILDGNNIWTEQTLPLAWINKNPNNLFQIHKKFGSVPLKNYPARFKNERYIKAKGSYKGISLLNFLDYNKQKTKSIIAKELNWKDYGGKHYESVFTRFYQGYILPHKFKVDKRKAHLSNLIFSGQIKREDAINQLQVPIYPRDQLSVDKDFVLKKLGFGESDFENCMNAAPVPHELYGGMESDKEKLLAKVRRNLGAVKNKVFNHGTKE